MKISYYIPFTVTHMMRFSNAAFEMQNLYGNNNQALYVRLSGHTCRRVWLTRTAQHRRWDVNVEPSLKKQLAFASPRYPS